ncbi:MAG: sulfatase-like hydrolase/transferase [Kiritimatiellales bacterium]|nr:sulfatase-like hydrolase/transferase [Kiritimatiellales bacterium]
MERRAFFSQGSCCIGATALVGLRSASLFADERKRRPKNVLFLMADEYNVRYLSANGHPQALTPNLDRLIREGAYFENALCSYPVCTPSRGTLHTGMWPHTHGQELNVNEAKAEDAAPGTSRGGLTAETRLLATSFHENGFACYHRGKWHLGAETRHACYNWNPRAEASDTSQRAFLAQWKKSHPVPADLPEGSWNEAGGWPVYAIPGMEKFKETKLPYIAGRCSLPLAQDPTVYYADRALEDLKERGGNPFMLTWSDPRPHGPHTIPDPYYDAVNPDTLPVPDNLHRPDYCAQDPSCQSYDKLMEFMGEAGVREYLRCYTGLVRKMDDQIGRLIQSLEQSGELEDTLIVFTADHGDMGGSHRTGGGKAIWEFYDEIVKVPLIMFWPKGIPAGRRIKTMAEGVDVMPTILDYAGLPVSAQCQGRSLRPYVEGAEDLDRPAFCEATNPEANLVRRLIRTQEWGLWFYCQGKPGQTFKEIRPVELYDMVNDPGQEHNLAGDPKHADVKKKMIKGILDWMERTGDPWLENMPYSQS